MRPQAAKADTETARNVPLGDSSPFDLQDIDTTLFRRGGAGTC